MSKNVSLNAASKYLSALAPNVEEFTFQTFADRKDLKTRDATTGKMIDPLAAVLKGSLSSLAPKLQRLNSDGAGIFVTVNATSGRGRKRSNFAHPRATWADLDDARPRKWPIAPSLIVRTSQKKTHVYWLIDGDMPLLTWQACMARIVETYGADKAATDPVRVLRVPGFFHCKGASRMVELAQCSGRRYSPAQLERAFPPIKQAKPKSTGRSPAMKLDIDVDALRNALEHLAATPCSKREHSGTYVDDYETWTRFGLALKRDLGEPGFAMWHEWSKYSDRYPGHDACRSKWDDDLDVALEEGAIHVSSIFFAAQRQGWSMTRFQVADAVAKARNRIGARKAAA